MSKAHSKGLGRVEGIQVWPRDLRAARGFLARCRGLFEGRRDWR